MVSTKLAAQTEALKLSSGIAKYQREYEDVKQFQDAVIHWAHCKDILQSLQSQGKYCPREALTKAIEDCWEAVKAYKSTRVYRERKSCERYKFLTELLP